MLFRVIRGQGGASFPEDEKWHLEYFTCANVSDLRIPEFVWAHTFRISNSIEKKSTCGRRSSDHSYWPPKGTLQISMKVEISWKMLFSGHNAEFMNSFKLIWNSVEKNNTCGRRSVGEALTSEKVQLAAPFIPDIMKGGCEALSQRVSKFSKNVMFRKMSSKNDNFSTVKLEKFQVLESSFCTFSRAKTWRNTIQND